MSLVPGDPGGGGLTSNSGPAPLRGAGLGNEEIKTQFMTREGLYKVVAPSEYSKPNRAAAYSIPPGPATMAGPAGSTNGSGGGPPAVRVSFSAINPNPKSENLRIVFNFGREIFVYPYRGLKKAADLMKPIDKRTYKGTCPTCHDFGTIFPTGGNSVSAGSLNQNSESGSQDKALNGTLGGIESGGGVKYAKDATPLLIGFTQGQIQLVDPVRKQLSKLFNEERLIEKSRVTCVKWIPGSPNMFLVSFNSGNLYVFNHDLSCSPAAPVYQTFKQGEGYSIYTCKTKSTRNPPYKWSIGHGPVNQFAFSPCGLYLATVSQDGYLRVFNYNSMELIGLARSYFGGFSCVTWSPDGNLIACGGEDDFVTVYSKAENRVLLRGQGHRSWISDICFDQYNMSFGDIPDGLDFSGSDDEGSVSSGSYHVSNGGQRYQSSVSDSNRVTCYRLGSVGEDAHLCLWDLTEDMLKLSLSPVSSVNLSSTDDITSSSLDVSSSHHKKQNSHSSSNHNPTDNGSNVTPVSSSSSTSLTQRLAALNFGDKHKEQKRNFSLTGSNKSEKNSLLNSSLCNISSSHSSHSSVSNPWTLPEYIKLGSPQCPKINQVPLIEPLVCKRISSERLTSIKFLEECFVTSCQDGIISTWSRPGKMIAKLLNCPGSPLPSTSSGGGGTIV